MSKISNEIGGSKVRAKAAEARSRHHKKARDARSTEIAEDYVEVIAELIRTRGEARVVDIARELGVSHVTVNRTVARLQKNELVKTERYRSVFLTEQGAGMAEQVAKRHKIVESFLEALGVSPTTAKDDAEGIEHHVSAETLKAFERFIARSGKRGAS